MLKFQTSVVRAVLNRQPLNGTHVLLFSCSCYYVNVLACIKMSSVYSKPLTLLCQLCVTVFPRERVVGTKSHLFLLAFPAVRNVHYQISGDRDGLLSTMG